MTAVGETDEPVYVISVAARMLEVHPQTLRLYERLGLIVPTRTKSNIRLYSESDVERVRRIQHLTQDMGVNLAGVEIILELLDRINQERERTMAEVREEIEDRLLRLRQEWEAEVRRAHALERATPPHPRGARTPASER